LTIAEGGGVIGNILNNSILRVDRNTTLSLGGTISGTGSFIKDGTGNTVFLGANTYTGGTTINSGMLALGGNGSLTGDIVNNGLFVNERTADWSYGGTMTGSGLFVHGSAAT